MAKRVQTELTMEALEDLLHLPDDVEIETARFDETKHCLRLVLTGPNIKHEHRAGEVIERVQPRFMWEDLF